MVSKEVFQENFWWCHNRLKEAATDEVGMPGYFRFLVLLGEWEPALGDAGRKLQVIGLHIF
jgi:hypothetical protein